jgi:hypothetical protein
LNATTLIHRKEDMLVPTINPVSIA